MTLNVSSDGKFVFPSFPALLSAWKSLSMVLALSPPARFSRDVFERLRNYINTVKKSGSSPDLGGESWARQNERHRGWLDGSTVITPGAPSAQQPSLRENSLSLSFNHALTVTKPSPPTIIGSDAAARYPSGWLRRLEKLGFGRGAGRGPGPMSCQSSLDLGEAWADQGGTWVEWKCTASQNSDKSFVISWRGLEPYALLEMEGESSFESLLNDFVEHIWKASISSQSQPSKLPRRFHSPASSAPGTDRRAGYWNLEDDSTHSG